MSPTKVVSIEKAAASSDPAELQAGFVGDLSGLSLALRGNVSPAVLKADLEAFAQDDSDPYKPGILQDGSGVEAGTIRKTLRALQEIAAAATGIAHAGKEAILGDSDSLEMVRKHLTNAINEVAALEWESSQLANLDCWAEPPLGVNGIDWVDKIFAQSSPGSKALQATAFQILMVYQHLKFMLGLEDERGWRTVSTSVLGAEVGGSGGLRMLLTVSLIQSPLEGFIPDLRYFGLTELKHGDREHCLLNSAQRCWVAAQVSGYRGIWRLEHVRTASASEMMAVPHIYGRSFEAAFVCCLRAAAGNAYDDKLPDDQSERERLLELDPLSQTVAISASLDFDSQTAIKDIPLIPVTGVPQKLCEARGTEITQVVFATGQWDQKRNASLSAKDQVDLQQSQSLNQAPENQSKLQWSTAANIGEALDALLVRSRWLKAWQKETRNNWLRRWEARTDESPGARAPGDDEPGPDDHNKPKLDVESSEVVTDEPSAAE